MIFRYVITIQRNHVPKGLFNNTIFRDYEGSMNRLVFVIAIVVAISTAFCFSAAYCGESTKTTEQLPSAELPAMNPEYKIGPGDGLRITEWRNEDLTLPVVVLPDGFISFPLVGDLLAAGKTVSQLKSELEAKLKVYIPEPTVSIMVTNVESVLIYVIGRVNRPGVYPLNTNVNVLQALAMSGGLTPFAKRGDIKVLRGTGVSTQVFAFDYDEVSEGEDLEQNIVLNRGDVIVVP